jgi:hypothetical protein
MVSASLVIRADVDSPDVITQILGIPCSRSYTKAEELIAGIPISRSTWILSTNDRIELQRSDVDKHIAWITDQLGGSFIDALSKLEAFDIAPSIVIYPSAESDFRVTVAHHVLLELARANVDLHFRLME